MSNESIFVASVLVDIVFVFFAARRGVEWLLGTIVVNLILVGILGSKLIAVFGLETNVGNVFYACTFLATHLMLEQHGRRVGMKTICYGGCFVIFFAVMAQMTARFVGLDLTALQNTAVSTLFVYSVRVTVASLLAYTFSQYINISVFEWIKAQTKGKHLWLRSNGANVVAQLVDSMVFFSIAFFDLPGAILLQAILAGWAIKSLVVLAGTPFMYLSAYFDRKKHG